MRPTHLAQLSIVLASTELLTQCQDRNTFWCCEFIVWPNLLASLTDGLSAKKYVSDSVYRTKVPNIMTFGCHYSITSSIAPHLDADLLKIFHALTTNGFAMSCGEGLTLYVSENGTWGGCLNKSTNETPLMLLTSYFSAPKVNDRYLEITEYLPATQDTRKRKVITTWQCSDISRP